MSMTIINAAPITAAALGIDTKKHNYTLRATEGKWEVVVSPTTKYGYFEHSVHGEGGGLWFDKDKRVEDYDGVGILPKDVVKALRSLGYIVPRSCY